MNKHNKDGDEQIFYAQVDSFFAAKDYLRGGRCVRLIAIEPKEFQSSTLKSGLTTYIIDIDFWVFCKLYSGIRGRAGVYETFRKIGPVNNDGSFKLEWWKLVLQYDSGATSYLYQTFSDERPRFISISSFEPIPNGPTVPPLSMSPAFLTPPRTGNWPFAAPSPKNTAFQFDSFHVGQGMCSLVHNGAYGILLDMGAGKPVTRALYQAKAISNDLSTIIANLTEVILVISHADSDHWRVIGWDATILKKISAIYAPVGAISTAMQDKAVSKKIQGIGDTTFSLTTNTKLELWRSAPAHPDSNGECLVAVFVRGKQRVLAPGDYVYERFTNDKNSGISNLHSHSYSAVVVPHHGDESSGNNLISPDSDRAIAYFSAGTHQTWGHPTNTSLDAHTAARFKNRSIPNTANIEQFNLI